MMDVKRTGPVSSIFENADRTQPMIVQNIEIPYKKRILSNGLTLIVHQDHKMPIVAVHVLYHVGSKDERPGRTGFAHLFEHLMFSGSENYDDNFFRPLLAAGATQFLAWTRVDRTTYFENIPVGALDLALWLESDRMGHLLGAVDQRKLDVQRAVVMHEVRGYRNAPYGRAADFIAANTYPVGHPYSWTEYGAEADLSAASLDDVTEWFATYYGAANTVLVVAGDVEAQQIEDKVELYFGDISSGPPLARPRNWVAKMTGETRTVLQDRVSHARIYKVWNIPGHSTREFAVLQLAASILGGGENSRLWRRLVYANHMCTAVSVDVRPLELGSQFQIVATVTPGIYPKAVEMIVDQETAQLWMCGPTDTELRRVKMMRYSSFLRATERLDGNSGKAAIYGGKSAILGESQINGGSPDFYKQSLQWMYDTTPADIQDIARTWLSDGVFVLEIEPAGAHKPLGGGANRSKPPATNPSITLNLPPLEWVILSNGLKVALATRHHTPVVEFNLILDAGFASDSLAKPGTAHLALAIAKRGTHTRDAFQISERAEQLGALINVGSTLDTSFLSLNTLADRLPDSLELFSDILLNPNFSSEELTRLKAQAASEVQEEMSHPVGIATRLLPRLLYGEQHAYATPLSGMGSQDSIDTIIGNDLKTFHQRWVRPDNATLLIVGNTTLATIQPLLELRLSTWKPASARPPAKRLDVTTQHLTSRVFLVNYEGTTQSLVMVANLVPPRSAYNEAALQVVKTVFGGFFISRVNLNLREDKHWSNWVQTTLLDTKGLRTFVTQSLVQSDRTADSMQELFRELCDLIGPRPPTDRELRFAKDMLTRRLPGDNETSSQIAASYTEVLSHGLPESYFNNFIGQIETVTADQLHLAAKQLVQPASLTWLVVGDLATIENRVRELNLGVVTKLDKEGHILN